MIYTRDSFVIVRSRMTTDNGNRVLMIATQRRERNGEPYTHLLSVLMDVSEKRIERWRLMDFDHPEQREEYDLAMHGVENALFFPVTDQSGRAMTEWMDQQGLDLGTPYYYSRHGILDPFKEAKGHLGMNCRKFLLFLMQEVGQIPIEQLKPDLPEAGIAEFRALISEVVDNIFSFPIDVVCEGARGELGAGSRDGKTVLALRGCDGQHLPLPQALQDPMVVSKLHSLQKHASAVKADLPSVEKYVERFPASPKSWRHSVMPADCPAPTWSEEVASETKPALSIP